MAPTAARVLTVWLLAFHCLLGQQPSPPPTSGRTSALLILNLDGPSEVFIDGENVASAASAGIRKFVVSPGNHFLEVKSNGRIWQKNISLPAGAQIVPFINWKWWTLKDSGPQRLRI
jgi:hypothetical protein